MVKTIISVDPKKLPWEQSPPVHNRWHPDIPAVASVKEGEVFRVECIDWTGGQIKNDDNSDDVKNVDLSQVYVTCYSNGVSCVFFVYSNGLFPSWLLISNVLLYFSPYSNIWW